MYGQRTESSRIYLINKRSAMPLLIIALLYGMASIIYIHSRPSIYILKPSSICCIRSKCEWV